MEVPLWKKHGSLLQKDKTLWEQKSFVAQVTSGLYYKNFKIVIYDHNDTMIVIYDRNDSGQYYKTKASITNYNSSITNKWRHNLERTLRS